MATQYYWRAVVKSLTVRIADALDRRLVAEARKLGVSKSQMVREALEVYLEMSATRIGLSMYDLTRDLAGAFEGPPDLSTNPKYLEGYGR
jgi:hypothetical protein